ncbi:DnaJ domain containing protein [Reticulomyxa filosa]|uniref:DnaJ domain containing protein n=1 Tax=Reticulomyxa filosa TaxID=46433 RepID=X6LH26_RETFI|nr:DnaJ domain containing protein [Reticulomyxa filosa]|eukprot:ETO01288.1 DnaJ domain containing protein [Reticulomyxa filosa]
MRSSSSCLIRYTSVNLDHCISTKKQILLGNILRVVHVHKLKKFEIFQLSKGNFLHNKKSFHTIASNLNFWTHGKRAVQYIQNVNTPKLSAHTTIIRNFTTRIDTSKDYYATLGISRSSSTKDVRSAYIKLAKEWHPDVHMTKSEREKETVKRKFQEIQEAYEILSDESLRKKYDEMRRLETRFHYRNTNSNNSGYKTSYTRNAENDWERLFRSQMQAEWEKMRSQQQQQRYNRYYSNPFFGTNLYFGQGLGSALGLFMSVFVIIFVTRLQNPWDEWKINGPASSSDSPQTQLRRHREEQDRKNDQENRGKTIHNQQCKKFVVNVIFLKELQFVFSYTEFYRNKKFATSITVLSPKLFLGENFKKRRDKLHLM